MNTQQTIDEKRSAVLTHKAERDKAQEEKEAALANANAFRAEAVAATGGLSAAEEKIRGLQGHIDMLERDMEAMAAALQKHGELVERLKRDLRADPPGLKILMASLKSIGIS